MSTPQHCPSPRELDDLELLTTGALLPLSAFNQPGSVVTLDLPASLADEDEIELVDPEGLPLAVMRPRTGEVTALTDAHFGPFRRLYLNPRETGEQFAGRTLVPVTDALTKADLDAVRRLGPVLLVALAGHGTPALSPVALIRATLAAADLLDDAEVLVVPLAAHGDADADHELGVRVLANYAGDDPVHALPSAPEVEEGAPRPSPSEVEEGAPRPSRNPYPETIAAIIDRDEPAPDEQGLVLFFTGLSGSGKSTLARALMDRVLEQGIRSVTSLDGDVVRRNLSAGLTFSKEDRETNIRRIGWVAAEISRHHGLAIVSPIAPFASTRADVREYVEAAGGAFFLIHVATPLEECERRDRKGLYAKARRGEIPEFTGISSPYEEPADASVRVDTTGRTIEDALDDVIEALAVSGHLDLRPVDPARQVTGEQAVTPVDPARQVTGEQAVTPVDPARQVTGEQAVTPVDPAREVTGQPLRVLFVCTANICRSAYAEISARQLAGENSGLAFSSAGTHGFTDYPMDEVMASTLEHPDADFRSKPVTRELVERADVILTAEASHRTFLLEEYPQALRKSFTLGQFAASARMFADLRGRELIETASHRRTPADPALDVGDPYRRGSAAAQTTAGTISSLLSVIVPALTEEN